MNSVHLHLLLNHAPVLGVLFGTALILFAFIRRSNDLKRLALGLFIISGLLSIPVYLTGEPAEHRVEALPGVSHAVVESHEQAAEIAFIGFLALGAVALVNLIWTWRKVAVPTWVVYNVLPVALIVSTLAVWTANLGGQVRHSEIRGPAPVESTMVDTDDN